MTPPVTFRHQFYIELVDPREEDLSELKAGLTLDHGKVLLEDLDPNIDGDPTHRITFDYEDLYPLPQWAMDRLIDDTYQWVDSALWPGTKVFLSLYCEASDENGQYSHYPIQKATRVRNG